MSTAIRAARMRFSVFAMSTAVARTLNGKYLFYSLGNNYYGDNRLAPVVSLGSGVQVKSGSGTTRDPYVIGK